jgi:hypothetical protein
MFASFKPTALDNANKDFFEIQMFSVEFRYNCFIDTQNSPQQVLFCCLGI